MLWLLGGGALAQVNVFLGTSGDHGQMSPGAGTPFGLLSISPHTYPTTHAGYEHKAIKTLGFTHNRMEGTGCQGSGGILLLKPFIADPNERFLHKEKEQAGPGYYSARYREGIRTRIDVNGNEGKHAISFQKGIEPCSRHQ
jgi:putative alpha-1,2-mannosidase